MIINKSIIVFGKGDILITPAVGMQSGYGKILFNELEKPTKIGAEFKDLDAGNYADPIELIFEKTESIDVLIKSLEICKENMIQHQKRERGEQV